MRRPSPIPPSAPPVAPAKPLRPAGEAAAAASRGSAPRSARDAAEALDRVVTDEDDRLTAPIRIDRGLLAGDRAESDAVMDGPFTARDLWRAAKARRRALRAEIRRFTQRSRRRRIIAAVAVLIAVLIVGGSIGAAYSPLFAVQTITVEGASALKPSDVQKALSGQLGKPLALVDAGAVKTALATFPLVETYRLEAHPPHDLVVRIVERTPVGVITSDRGFTVVDAAGVSLSSSLDRPAGYALIEVEGGTDAPAFRAAGTVLRALPADLRARVDSVTATTRDDVELQLAGGTKVVWGSADRSALKTKTLQALMTARPDQALYDVSSPDVGVVG